VRYEWDDAKNVQNQRKHGSISFELAALVFEDKQCLIGCDRIDSRTGEQRWHAIGAVRSPRGAEALLLVVHVYKEDLDGEEIIRIISARQADKRTSADIKNRRWTKKESDTIDRLARKQAAGDDSGINYSDIPPLTAEQLQNMVRLRDVRQKVAVSVRLDPGVLEWLKSKGKGHLTRINDILVNLMEAERRSSG